jgi:hypothetical protein
VEAACREGLLQQELQAMEQSSSVREALPAAKYQVVDAGVEAGTNCCSAFRVLALCCNQQVM